MLKKTTPEPRVKTVEKETVKNIESLEPDNIKNKEVSDLNIDHTPEIEEVITESEVFDNGYIYDPLVASSELGLPDTGKGIMVLDESIGELEAGREFGSYPDRKSVV